MAISSNYGTLCQQVADELGDRTELLATLGDQVLLTTSPIQNAVQTAISKWEREPFYFNEIYDLAAAPFFTTVIGQEFYTVSDAPSIGTTPDLIHMHVLVNGQRYPMTPRTWQYMDDTSVNPQVTGYPFDYAVLQNLIRLYPIPDGIYPMSRTGTQRLSALVNPTDANAWTQDAFDLIRSEAKLIIAREVIHDNDLADRMMIAIYGNPANPRDRGYLYALKGETTRRMSNARVRLTHF